jgi:formate dehydrogenase major subunit
MTNHWADIANSTNIVVWGANPVENHPACIAHINRARFPKQFFSDTLAPKRQDKKPAKLIVIDPRKNRTAMQCDEANGDKYIRIRPGTDIAFENGLVRYMIKKIEALPSGDSVRVAFFAHLNQNAAGTFYTDGSATTASAGAANGTSGAQGAGLANGNSKYTDARFLVNAAGTDYQRKQITVGTGLINDPALPADNTTIANFPVKAIDCADAAQPDTVYNRLKAHVEPYTPAVVADICQCLETDIAFVGDAFIENSKCSNGVNANGTPSVIDARDPNYRATTLLYAMGITQHTCGSQNIKGFALIQTLMGNMGRAGGGINALRGIHNVQGSTDMGLLNGNIPAYSSNPTAQATVFPDGTNAFGKYMDNLWGTPLSGTGGKAQMNGSYDDAYTPAQMALQQRGFFNMTLKWFGDYTSLSAGGSVVGNRAKIDACYSLWPKGNGHDHITMFRSMAGATPVTKAAVVWGQNPAVTEPNQGAVRAGLYNLDLLVSVDMFQNETNAVSRKPGSVTILIPTAAHVEKAGSATNSGRTLQWRYQGALPAGNSKDDTELLLRFAKALDTAGAFSHIKAVWDANTITYATDVYTQLYGAPYAYSGTGSGFAGLTGTGELVNVRKIVSDPVTYNTAANNLVGSEWVAELVYREFTSPVQAGGTMWIYTGAYNNEAAAATGGPWATANIPPAYTAWVVRNRAKSRDRQDPAGQLMSHGWGYSWLVNRRVFYNNSDVPGDIADFFMGADSCSRLFTSSAPPAQLHYSRWYRTYHKLADKPSPVFAADTASPHFVMDTQVVPAKISYAGKFPGHTEPYETPRQDLLAVGSWGRNTKNTAVWDLVKADTAVAGRDVAAAGFPLVLTTIRCVEHFQGGPITRNNWFNVELEPEPWIEINSADARAAVPPIKDGDMVKVVTARTEPLVNNEMPLYGSGFRARVGTGLATGQKVASGVVAIPWHWGDKGLSTGSRANDLCIDAGDANSVIPEYKACLCRIEKI